MIGACGLAQVAADRREARFRTELTAFVQRKAYDSANRAITVVALLGEDVLDARKVSALLQRESELLDGGLTRDALPPRRALAAAAQVRPLSDDEQAEFDQCLGRLAVPLLDGLAPLFDRGATRPDYRHLKSLAVAAQTRVLTDEEKAGFKQRLAPLKAHVQHELEVRLRELWREKRPAGRRPCRPGIDEPPPQRESTVSEGTGPFVGSQRASSRRASATPGAGWPYSLAVTRARAASCRQRKAGRVEANSSETVR